MLKDSYTMLMEENVKPLSVTGLGLEMARIPQEYLYKACPRCKDGTLYSPPEIKDFRCVVCGWQQKCRNCFGDVVMQGTTKVCKGCSKTTSTGNPRS